MKVIESHFLSSYRDLDLVYRYKPDMDESGSDCYLRFFLPFLSFLNSLTKFGGYKPHLVLVYVISLLLLTRMSSKFFSLKKIPFVWVPFGRLELHKISPNVKRPQQSSHLTNLCVVEVDAILFIFMKSKDWCEIFSEQ